jgi:aspartate carbamoyltransferase catalytic subunit
MLTPSASLALREQALSSACKGADVLEVTRLQKQRFDYRKAYEKAKALLFVRLSSIWFPHHPCSATVFRAPVTL